MNTLRCKECDKMGAPVEGMTGQCPICGELFCLGHLDNHDHDISEVRFADLRVIGVDRVGSKAKAIQGHRCRNRKYWAIGYFDKRERIEGDFKNPIKYPYGNRICTDSPHFKTRKEAELYLINRASH